MNQDLQWLSRHIEELRAATRQSQWHLETLQEYRGELASTWNDSCAAEMNRRFLDPMASDGATSVKETTRQAAELDDCIAALAEGSEQVRLAGLAAQEVGENLDAALAIFRALDSGVGEALDRVGDALELAKRVQSLLQQAESAGT